jgi:hypothetical protein
MAVPPQKGAGKQKDTLHQIQAKNNPRKKGQRTTDNKDKKDGKSSKYPGALYKQKDKIMSRDRKGAFRYAEIMEIRKILID